MTRVFSGRPVIRWLALAVALFAVLGHVCVLPHETHAVTADPSEHHGSHDGHSEHDAVHAASCEAVAASVASPAPVLLADGRVVVAAATVPATMVSRTPRSRTSATSPPLFLLHSAFLI
jgi:hypothetical protein